MKLLTCEYQGRRFAAVSDGRLVYEAAPDMLTLIKSLGGALPDESMLAGEGIALADVRVLSPIPEPVQDVVCLGMNYVEHSAEAEKWGGEAEFKKNAGKAVYFSKRAAYIIGPDDHIDGHFDIVDSLDYEVELAVILGRDAYRVSEEDAADYVLGYSVLNDVSARNLQTEHHQWYFGKSLDGFTPMGPCIVTADEIAFPPALAISSTVNGEVRQKSNTDHLLHSVAEIISELSQGMTLRAGTIIATGTPAGVGMGFTPPRFLKKGDVVTCEIEGIGKLTNTVE